MSAPARLGLPVPARMLGLPRDARGYVIPVNVQRDPAGRPHFTVNDAAKSLALSLDKRCGICGQELERDTWFVGGPLSALHVNGRYFDGPVHGDCGRYALQVCPWLAAPRYARRIEDRTVPEELRPAVMHDPTMMPDRPEVFVIARTRGYALLGHHHAPTKPWLRVEFWREGVRLPLAQARPLIEAGACEWLDGVVWPDGRALDEQGLDARTILV